MTDNTDNLVTLGKSLIINLLGAFVMALVIAGGAYLLMTNVGMDQVASVTLMGLIATPVFSMLPASTKGLATALQDAILGYLKKEYPAQKKNDSGAVSVWAYIITVIVLVVILGAIVAVYYFNFNLWLPIGAAVIFITGILGGKVIKPAKTYQGVLVKDNMAYISWDSYTGKIYIAAVPAGCIQANITYKGTTWISEVSRFNPADGNMYGNKDPISDEFPVDNIDILNHLSKLPGKDALEYIVNLCKNPADVKMRLLFGSTYDKTIKAMKDGDGHEYNDFVNNLPRDAYNGQPGGLYFAFLTYETNKTQTDATLHAEAEKVYWDYYKKGA